MSPFNDGRRGFICFLFNLWKHSRMRNWKWNHFIIQNQKTIESDLWAAVIVISSAVSFPVLFFKQCLWYVNKLQANEEQMKAKSYLRDPSRSATHFVCNRYARKVRVLCRRCNNQGWRWVTLQVNQRFLCEAPICECESRSFRFFLCSGTTQPWLFKGRADFNIVAKSDV